MNYAVGSLVTARGREWVVLPESAEEFLLLRPLAGSDEEIAGIHTALETVAPASLPLPTPAELGDFRSARLLRDAVRLGFRSSAGPFRSFGRIACEPRPYQLVPLLLALRLNPVRLLIADDVGIGKTIEAGLIARELLDRGEVRRLAVLCPPHLAEQWQRELALKFSLDAELVLPSTAKRLEAVCGVGKSLFDHYPYVIVSTDYVKSDRHRADFLRACPELVIVDEAHTCAGGGTQRSAAHQRGELLRGLAADPSRHLILVTATPHSGKEDAFRSLLALLDPDFATLPSDLSGPANEAARKRLAAHFVQRRRADIKDYLNAITPFPDRQEKEVTYTLHPDYAKLFKRAVEYASTLVQDEAGGPLRKRIRLWSALALLRSLASSPAAAAETLRNRAAVAEADTVESADEIGGRTVLDAASDDLEPGDVSPGSSAEPDGEAAGAQPSRKLLSMAADAEQLAGEKDQKLVKAIAMVKSLLREGYHPIVFCRFIPTADHVAQALRQALPKSCEVASVTGALSPEERELRVAALARANSRVLVCTDCLSEGINLQESFDAVLHYDLAWNPTRHEQREGRVDRYGQNSDKGVRVITYYGIDNQIDGVVLDVLLRKHRAIRNSLGVSVPVPANSDQVMTALLHGALLRSRNAQLPLDFGAQGGDGSSELHEEWDSSAEREKRSRTLFAQRSIDPREVAAELASAQRAVGGAADVEHFVHEALSGYGAEIAPSASGTESIRLHEVRAAVRDALAAGEREVLQVRYTLPCPEGTAYLSRTHPLVQGLAGFVLDSALDPQSAPDAIARRAGVIRTAAVTARTTMLLLRERFQIRTGSADAARSELLAEDWQIVAFRGSPAAPEWLPQAEAEALLESRPTSNISSDIARAHLAKILEALPQLHPAIDSIVSDRAAEILEAHQRLRRAARLKGPPPEIEPKLPADILGVYLHLPAGGGAAS